MGELKKIELRKKEREKKQQDLQKLITAADSNADNRKADRKSSKKKLQAKELKLKDGGGVGVISSLCLGFNVKRCTFTCLKQQKSNKAADKDFFNKNSSTKFEVCKM